MLQFNETHGIWAIAAILYPVAVRVVSRLGFDVMFERITRNTTFFVRFTIRGK